MPWRYRKVQNCAAQDILYHASLKLHTTPTVMQLHWLPIHAHISYNIAYFCLSSINSSTPVYLSDILHFYSPSWSLWSSADTHLVKLPLYKYEMKSDHAFSHFGPSVWNSLPPISTITTFKSTLKTHFFSLCPVLYVLGVCVCAHACVHTCVHVIFVLVH